MLVVSFRQRPGCPGHVPARAAHGSCPSSRPNPARRRPGPDVTSPPALPHTAASAVCFATIAIPVVVYIALGSARCSRRSQNNKIHSLPPRNRAVRRAGARATFAGDEVAPRFSSTLGTVAARPRAFARASTMPRVVWRCFESRPQAARRRCRAGQRWPQVEVRGRLAPRCQPFVDPFLRPLYACCRNGGSLLALPDPLASFVHNGCLLVSLPPSPRARADDATHTAGPMAARRCAEAGARPPPAEPHSL